MIRLVVHLSQVQTETLDWIMRDNRSYMPTDIGRAHAVSEILLRHANLLGERDDRKAEADAAQQALRDQLEAVRRGTPSARRSRPNAQPAAATANGTPDSANVSATRETPSNVAASPAPPTAISRCASRPRCAAPTRAKTSATSKAATTARCTPPASRCQVRSTASRAPSREFAIAVGAVGRRPNALLAQRVPNAAKRRVEA